MLEKLDKDMIEAMKNKEKDRLTVIRMVKAALKQEQIDHKKELTEQLSLEEVKEIISRIFDEIKPEGQKDMGKVMKAATEKLKGKADMKEVSTIIREMLNS